MHLFTGYPLNNSAIRASLRIIQSTNTAQPIGHSNRLMLLAQSNALSKRPSGFLQVFQTFFMIYMSRSLTNLTIDFLSPCRLGDAWNSTLKHLEEPKLGDPNLGS